MDHDEARQVITAIIAGHSAAEDRFFEEFRHEIELFVKHRIGKNNPDWKDLHQDIFMDLFKRIRTGAYDPHRGSVGAFVFSSARFKVMDYLKSKHRRNRRLQCEIPEKEMRSLDEEPVETLIRAEEIKSFERALKKLPEPHRTILISFFYKELKIIEIAEQLGMTEQKVSNYKSYALALIKKRTKL